MQDKSMRIYSISGELGRNGFRVSVTEERGLAQSNTPDSRAGPF